MDDLHGLALDDPDQGTHVGPQGQRVLAGDGQAQQLTAQRGELVLKPSALARDQSAATVCDDRLGDFQRRPLGTAGFEFGDHLENDHEDAGILERHGARRRRAGRWSMALLS